MGKIFYEVGFTDELYDGLVPGDNHNGESNFNYNLRKAATKKEKSKLTWELYDTPIVRAMIDRWEHVIRSPHLLMCSLDKRPNHHLDDENDLTLRWEYINLVPIKHTAYVLTKDDAESMEVTHMQFGELYLPYYGMIRNSQSEYSTHWQYTVDKQNMDHLEEGPVILEALPMFDVKLNLEKPFNTITDMRPYLKNWMSGNQEVLSKLGYFNTDPRCKIGNIPVGKLLNDPNDARVIVNSNNYMCRHSIISEDMHKKANNTVDK